MNITTMHDLLDAVHVSLDAVRTELGPRPVIVPPTVLIDTPDALDRALSLAVAGDVLTLAPTFVYPSPLALRTPITLQGSTLPDGRMIRDHPLPRFLGGLAIPGDLVTLRGVAVSHFNPLTDLLTIAGQGVTLDRVRLLGDPEKGAKRGIAANGNGGCVIVRCFVDDCFQSSPGSDSQAICAWDMGPGLRLEDNWLSAGSETILLGGSDNASDARTPADVIILGNTITANPAWMTQPIGVKTRLELKNCKRVHIEHNIIEHCWRQGQTGYLFTASVRNQDGRNPWATIEDVEVLNNQFAHGAAAINLLGRDDIKEYKTGRPVPIGTVRQSGVMTRVRFAGNTWSDLDPKVWTNDVAAPGSNKLIQCGGGPIDLTIDGNDFAMRNCGSQIYFQSGPKAERCTFARNTLPKSAYGIFGAGVSAGKGWDAYVASGTLGPNTETA